MSPRRLDMPPLRRDDLAADPFEQFNLWWELAVAEVPLADAITLATAGEDGIPDARMVLLKGHEPDGFRFFTNYESAKGDQLERSAVAAIVVYWRELDRQVRARGTVARLPEADSDAYFAGRPRDSQLGAWASPQSGTIESRELLEERLREAERRFAAQPVPRPPSWGGYLLSPDSVEFWQGRVGRLHDRFRYSRVGDGWALERLAP